MFRNNRGLHFQDVTTSGGFGQLQKGHAISFADFNRDGNEDVFEVLGGAVPGDTYPSVLLANPGHDNHWLGLKLTGVKSNRSAIGARVKVLLANRSIYRTVNSGSSFGDTPFEQHIGLGPATTVKQLEVRWPSGLTQTFTGLTADHRYQLREGDPYPNLKDIKPFAYRTTPVPHHHQM